MSNWLIFFLKIHNLIFVKVLPLAKAVKIRTARNRSTRSPSIICGPPNGQKWTGHHLSKYILAFVLLHALNRLRIVHFFVWYISYSNSVCDGASGNSDKKVFWSNNIIIWLCVFFSGKKHPYWIKNNCFQFLLTLLSSTFESISFKTKKKNTIRYEKKSYCFGDWPCMVSPRR